VLIRLFFRIDYKFDHVIQTKQSITLLTSDNPGLFLLRRVVTQQHNDVMLFHSRILTKAEPTQMKARFSFKCF
jgi:hypothetical protein